MTDGAAASDHEQDMENLSEDDCHYSFFPSLSLSFYLYSLHVCVYVCTVFVHVGMYGLVCCLSLSIPPSLSG